MWVLRESIESNKQRETLILKQLEIEITKFKGYIIKNSSFITSIIINLLTLHLAIKLSSNLLVRIKTNNSMIVRRA